jgi:hypothetical protein
MRLALRGPILRKCDRGDRRLRTIWQAMTHHTSRAIVEILVNDRGNWSLCGSMPYAIDDPDEGAICSPLLFVEYSNVTPTIVMA